VKVVGVLCFSCAASEFQSGFYCPERIVDFPEINCEFAPEKNINQPDYSLGSLMSLSFYVLD
jgi:hypothetical protein